jgi:hypothetical protein
MTRHTPGLRAVLGVVATATFSAACGGTPTQPTPPAPAAQTAPAPDPGPAPPAAAAAIDYVATVQSAHWYGVPPLFPSTFDVERFTDHVKIGTLDLPIVSQDAKSWIAMDAARTMTWSVVNSSWTFNGIAGQAIGTISAR